MNRTNHAASSKKKERHRRDSTAMAFALLNVWMRSVLSTDRGEMGLQTVR